MITRPAPVGCSGWAEKAANSVPSAEVRTRSSLATEPPRTGGRGGWASGPKHMPAVWHRTYASPVRVLVVVPTYQEAENVAELLRRLRAAVPAADVLVVDDSSPDGTAAMAK